MREKYVFVFICAIVCCYIMLSREIHDLSLEIENIRIEMEQVYQENFNVQ